MLALLMCAVACEQRSENNGSNDVRKNVLFITIDDLRPQLGCYDDPVAISPNIDRLATEGVLFERAYCQTALCGPSRTSFLTGYYPTTTGVYNNQTHVRDVRPDGVTLPQMFKNNGYISTGLFKIFHLAGFDPNLFENHNDSTSWSIPHWTPKRSAWGPYGDSIYQVNKKICLDRGPINYSNIPRSLAYEAPDVADSLLSDGETAQKALKYLRQFKGKQDPFFLAVGFYKPHLPFVAPKKYWDLYDRSKINLPENQYAPKGVSADYLPNAKELRSYVNIPESGPFDEPLKMDLLHGYLASMSYIDAQVGLLLNELKLLGLRDNTVVVVMGDHGYQIGEHNLWCKKHTNFELATRVPLIISAPDQGKRGAKSDALVELVDVYPTLADLCGLKAPGDLDGESLVPLMEDPATTWETFAFNAYGGNGAQKSLKTEHFNFNRRERADGPFFELYDHRIDADENINRANFPEYKTKVDSLNSVLNRFLQ